MCPIVLKHKNQTKVLEIFVFALACHSQENIIIPSLRSELSVVVIWNVYTNERRQFHVQNLIKILQ